MNIPVPTDDTLAIDGILRPISQAHRILRDHCASDAMLPGRVGDDPPSAHTVSAAIEAVRETLATTATPDTMKPLIDQMAFAEPSTLIESVAVAGKLPLAAVASAAGKHRADADLSPEAFRRSCIKAHRDIEELLHRLKQAEASLRPRFGWRR